MFWRSSGISFVLALTVLTVFSPAIAHGKATATNERGASISIAKKTYSKEGKIKVTGRGFDETVGIYLAYCVLPKKGEPPTPCGGGVNKAGIGEASHWISSNPPPYGAGLAIAYKAGGRFSEMVAITRKIGKYDCQKITCAITVRSDHLHEGDRSGDIYIPIKFRSR